MSLLKRGVYKQGVVTQATNSNKHPEIKFIYNMNYGIPIILIIHTFLDTPQRLNIICLKTIFKLIV